MPKLNENQLRERARLAAVESAGAESVGEFLAQIEEEENVFTYLFAAKMKGYVGWNWSVSLFANDEDATVSEVNLMPGDDSLIAPKWIPWSERLADYKALQAELEAQAALEAEDAEDAEDESTDEEVSEAEKVEELHEAKPVDADAGANDDEELTPELANEGPDAEQNADDASGRIPRFLRRRLGRLKNKKK